MEGAVFVTGVSIQLSLEAPPEVKTLISKTDAPYCFNPTFFGSTTRGNRELELSVMCIKGFNPTFSGSTTRGTSFALQLVRQVGVSIQLSLEAPPEELEG